MPDDHVIGIRLRADGRGFRGEIPLSERELERLTGATRRGGAESRRYADAAREVERATRRTAASGPSPRARGTRARSTGANAR